MLDSASMRQLGVVVLGLAFVLWCWGNTRRAEELVEETEVNLGTGKQRRRARAGKRGRRATSSRSTSPNRVLHSDAEGDDQCDDSELELDEDEELAALSPSRAQSPTPINDEIRFIAQTSTDGTRVLKLESRSLADQGDSPSTRAFYEILGRYSTIISEKEGANPTSGTPTPQSVPPTEAVLNSHNSRSTVSAKTRQTLKKNVTGNNSSSSASPFVSSPESHSSQSSSEEHEEEDEDDDLNHVTHRTTHNSKHRHHHHTSKKGGNALARPPSSAMSTASLRSRRSSARLPLRGGVNDMHSSARRRHSVRFDTPDSVGKHERVASGGGGVPVSPGLSAMSTPAGHSSHNVSSHDYYFASGGSTSGYRSENSSLRRPAAGSAARPRSSSASRSPNTLPPPGTLYNKHTRRYNYRHRRPPSSFHPHPSSRSTTYSPAPASNRPVSGVNTADPTSLSGSPSNLRPNSQGNPPPAYSSPANSTENTSSGGPGIYISEWEGETDSMSEAFSLAESFENDSTASNRVFATANMAVFSESDSLYRDEPVPLSGGGQHAERIDRLKQLRVDRKLPRSLTNASRETKLSSSQTSDEAGAASGSTPAERPINDMVFGPYADDSRTSTFLNESSPSAVAGKGSTEAGDGAELLLPTPPAPLASSTHVLSDVDEGDEEVAPVSSAPRLVTVTQ